MGLVSSDAAVEVQPDSTDTADVGLAEGADAKAKSKLNPNAKEFVFSGSFVR